MTLNGTFRSNEALKPSSYWYSFNRNCRKLNFVKIKRNYYCAMIFTKGCFKLLISDLRAIPFIHNIIRHIMMKYARKLFDARIRRADFRITQILMSIHPCEQFPLKLKAQIIKQIYPNLEVVINDLKFKFNACDLHFCEENCTSHFVAKILTTENLEIASMNVYTNLKIVLLIKFTSYLRNIHDAIPAFVENLQTRWQLSENMN